MAAQQLAACFDVGSGKQHTVGSGHARHASASGGPRATRSSRPRQEAAARGRRRGGTAMAALAAGREKLEEISRVKVDQGLYLFIRISNTGRWERKNPEKKKSRGRWIGLAGPLPLQPIGVPAQPGVKASLGQSQKIKSCSEPVSEFCLTLITGKQNPKK